MEDWVIWVLVILGIKAVVGICFLIYLRIQKTKRQERDAQARAARPQQYPHVINGGRTVPTVVVEQVRTPPPAASYPNGWQQPPPAYTQVTATVIPSQQVKY